MINKTIQKTDTTIAKLIQPEQKRQEMSLDLIPSENITSKAVMEALGSALTNKYSEGYSRKRYYAGNEVIDEIEDLAKERAKKVFRLGKKWSVNVQPYSGSPANMAVYFALLRPGDKLMGMSLPFGGHLTHGWKVNFSAKFYKSVQYGVGRDGYINYKEVRNLAKKEKPKIIVTGATAYSRIFDFKKFREIADEVGAYLMADISHIAGLVVAGVHPSPFLYADAVTTTTHKTLRGPRGAMIFSRNDRFLTVNDKQISIAEAIDRAVFPGLQGGPHDNQTVAIAVSLGEAAQPNFKKYSKQIVKNAKTLASELLKFKFNLVSGGTDNHLLLIDLSNKKANGALGAYALEVAGIVVNKNAVPNDPMPPFYPSGIRLGTPAITTMGMREKEMIKIAKWINDVIEEIKGDELPKEKESRSYFLKDFRKRMKENKSLLAINEEIKEFCQKFPVP